MIKTLNQNKVFYNIHALKLRKLKGYSILSSAFADSFRKKFKKHQNKWENVSVQFGPLTLMEGWIALEDETLENSITKLSGNFIEIEHLIEQTLKEFKN